MNSRVDYARVLLRRAMGDCYVVERLAEDTQAPKWVIGFHAQQAVEKSLKAVLSFHAVEFPRTHNLAMLYELVLRTSLPIPPDGDALNRLIPFGVALRYEDANDDDDLELDLPWTLQAVLRTLRWAALLVEAEAPRNQN